MRKAYSNDGSYHQIRPNTTGTPDVLARRRRRQYKHRLLRTSGDSKMSSKGPWSSWTTYVKRRSSSIHAGPNNWPGTPCNSGTTGSAQLTDSSFRYSAEPLASRLSHQQSPPWVVSQCESRSPDSVYGCVNSPAPHLRCQPVCLFLLASDHVLTFFECIFFLDLELLIHEGH